MNADLDEVSQNTTEEVRPSLNGLNRYAKYLSLRNRKIVEQNYMRDVHDSSSSSSEDEMPQITDRRAE